MLLLENRVSLGWVFCDLLLCTPKPVLFKEKDCTQQFYMVFSMGCVK